MGLPDGHDGLIPVEPAEFSNLEVFGEPRLPHDDADSKYPVTDNNETPGLIRRSEDGTDDKEIGSETTGTIDATPRKRRILGLSPKPLAVAIVIISLFIVISVITVALLLLNPRATQPAQDVSPMPTSDPSNVPQLSGLASLNWTDPKTNISYERIYSLNPDTGYISELTFDSWSLGWSVAGVVVNGMPADANPKQNTSLAVASLEHTLVSLCCLVPDLN
jgi:hypothetical protein